MGHPMHEYKYGFVIYKNIVLFVVLGCVCARHKYVHNVAELKRKIVK